MTPPNPMPEYQEKQLAGEAQHMSKEQIDLPVATEQELPELLPCPMCGKREYVGGKKHLVHEPGEEDFYWGFNVICNAAGIAGTRGCGTTGGWGETPAEAIANWNRRAPLSTLSHEGSSEDAA